MRIGDLVRNRATGDIALVTGVGGQDPTLWLTLKPIRGINYNSGTVYHAEFFEVISQVQEDDLHGE
jgi:hypothetical protein